MSEYLTLGINGELKESTLKPLEEVNVPEEAFERYQGMIRAYLLPNLGQSILDHLDWDQFKLFLEKIQEEFKAGGKPMETWAHATAVMAANGVGRISYQQGESGDWMFTTGDLMGGKVPRILHPFIEPVWLDDFIYQLKQDYFQFKEFNAFKMTFQKREYLVEEVLPHAPDRASVEPWFYIDDALYRHFVINALVDGHVVTGSDPRMLPEEELESFAALYYFGIPGIMEPPTVQQLNTFFNSSQVVIQDILNHMKKFEE